MRHFATLEADDDLDFVAALEESARMVDAGLEVVCINPAGKLDFLDLDDLLLLLCFFLTLVALKAVFAVVHDAAHRRLCLRGNQHEV